MKTRLSNAAYFSHPGIVLEYARAAVRVGLWESERVLCERHFPKAAPLLELGCGAGRIAFGLWQNGWSDIVATDVSVPMIEAAVEVGAALGTGVRLGVADATALPFEDGCFQSVIFGFNGLMMIPLAERRAKALGEICRVLRPGGVVIFTGHERAVPHNVARWAEERRRWAEGTQDPALEQLGDANHATTAGAMFIHSATQAETHALVEQNRLRVLFTAMRSEIALENAIVHEFSDDTRFWVAQKN